MGPSRLGRDAAARVVSADTRPGRAVVLPRWNAVVGGWSNAGTTGAWFAAGTLGTLITEEA